MEAAALPEQRAPTLATDRRGQPTVLLADPTGALGGVLRSVLIDQAGCRIVHAATVSDVIELIHQGLVGDLALISVQFRASTAVAISELRKAGWNRVLALTTASTSVDLIIDAVRAGASGVVQVAGVIDNEPAADNPARLLSARELEVVRLVADGKSNKEIATQLSLSALTVKNHLARIGRKFGVGDRAHIVAIACRGGVIANPSWVLSQDP